MKRLLKDGYDSFLASFEEGRMNALRVNRLKITPQQFEEAAPFGIRKVPWTDNGYYVDYRDMPGQHPWYRAGLYYLQEPSAMAPALILPVRPGDRVLDLCAAPGGKATELGARLGGEGILVANEVSASRVRALERNIELFGIRNCVVTNETPERLAEHFPAYFDSILVDAPCSGEGMFRKNPEAAKAWYPEKPARCASVQREILLHAADMLRPGGYLVYSTCTFEPLENELAVASLLQARTDMELEEIACEGGRASFSGAFSLPELREKGYLTGENDGNRETDSGHCAERGASFPGKETDLLSRTPEEEADLTKAVRIWPHLAGGEGHFIALLHRKVPGEGTGPEEKRETSGRRLAGRGGKTAPWRAGQERRPDPERKLITQFLGKYAPDLNIDMSRYEIRNGHVYLMPKDCPDLRGLHFLRAGLYAGELKKNRFEPSQELALALRAAGPDQDSPSRAGAKRAEPAKPLPDREDGKRGGIVDDGVCIRISSEDGRLQAFLRGETLRLEGAGESGWRLVCADAWPAGWGKLAGGVLKNHIPPAWRSTSI